MLSIAIINTFLIKLGRKSRIIIWLFMRQVLKNIEDDEYLRNFAETMNTSKTAMARIKCKNVKVASRFQKSLWRSS